MMIMKFTEKRRRRLNYVLFSFLVICMTPLCEKGRILSGASNSYTFEGEELVCAIDLGDDMYGAQGLKTGFSYELLEKFAKDNKCNVNVVISRPEENYIDSLHNGSIDILITNHENSSIDEETNVRELDRHSVWAVENSNVQKSRTLDIWMSHIKGSAEYKDLYEKFYRSFNPGRLADRGVRVKNVSPYDDLFKKYAAELGWDWRMLAAVVYQESKYSINSVSFRGATGLMQVMPRTGEYYGVTNLLDPEQNLQAGTKHLKRLQRMFSKSGMDSTELIKFTLAAYNAGEGRIADCRNFAASRNVDNNNWDAVVNLIPDMREDSILQEESVKLGKFHGYETIAYVDSVLAIYDSICIIHPSI